MPNQPPKVEEEELPIFVKWTEFIEWLFPRTEKFPRRARFTLALRIEVCGKKVVLDGDITEMQLADSAKSIIAHISKADTLSAGRKFFANH